jgi:acyl-CoA thioesterase-1
VRAPHRRGIWAVSTGAALGIAGFAVAGPLGNSPVAASDVVPADTSRPAAKTAVVIGLGDSVPAGLNCSCTNFVAAYATKAADAAHRTATVHNDAVPGSTSADLVDALADAAVTAQLRSATTVLIMTGANDFAEAFAAVSEGAPAAKTYAPVAAAVQTNVTTIVKRIHALNGRAHVVVLDYWAAMKDGAVAEEAYDHATMTAAAQSTAAVNGALAKAAKAAKAGYVSTYVPFKGADGRGDPTSLLLDDGDHPNAAGHRLIAKTLLAALPRG